MPPEIERSRVTNRILPEGYGRDLVSTARTRFLISNCGDERRHVRPPAASVVQPGVTGAGPLGAPAHGRAELADVQVGEGLELADRGLSAEVISQRANVRALRSFVS